MGSSGKLFLRKIFCLFWFFFSFCYNRNQEVPSMFYNNDVNRKVRDVINWKKGEAHAMDWLYIEVDDDQLIDELKISKKERTTVRLAMTNCLMEGDRIILDNKDNYAVRYYVDNLERRRIIDL